MEVGAEARSWSPVYTCTLERRKIVIPDKCPLGHRHQGTWDSLLTKDSIFPTSHQIFLVSLCAQHCTRWMKRHEITT